MSLEIWKPLAVLAAALLLASAACSSSTDATLESTASPPPESASDDATTAPTPTTEPNESAEEASATEDEECALCPLTDEDQARVDDMLVAYESGVWEDWTAHLVDDEPEWDTGIGPVPTELIRYDFIWSAALSQQITPSDCVYAAGNVVCDVTIVDDLHRALGEAGLEPSECSLNMTLEEGGIRINKYSIGSCFHAYDVAMHAYGAWFAENYPELDPIDGFHYRAWNQTDETAGARAAKHLAEFAVFAIAEVEENGIPLPTDGH